MVEIKDTENERERNMYEDKIARFESKLEELQSKVEEIK